MNPFLGLKKVIIIISNYNNYTNLRKNKNIKRKQKMVKRKKEGKKNSFSPLMHIQYVVSFSLFLFFLSLFFSILKI